MPKRNPLGGSPRSEPKRAQGRRSRESPVLKVSEEALRRMREQRPPSPDMLASRFRELRAEFSTPGGRTEQKRVILNTLWKQLPAEERKTLRKEGHLPPNKRDQDSLFGRRKPRRR